MAVLFCGLFLGKNSQALVSDYVESFVQFVKQRLHSGDVYLVFDRYFEFITNCSAQLEDPVVVKCFSSLHILHYPLRTKSLMSKKARSS